MAKVIIKNQVLIGQLPKQMTYTYPRLTINEKSDYSEPLIISLEDDNNETLVIEAKKHSNAKIILQLSKNDNSKCNYNLRLLVEENATVKYLLISELGSDDGYLNHDFEVKKDATLELMGGFLSNILNAKMTTKLTGSGASVFLRAVVISALNNKQNLDVKIIHEAPYTTGLMHNIAIASDNGVVRLNGIEKILQTMSKSETYQNLKGITTSDDATIEVNPILLIDEHDIKAGHGATVGKLEEHAIYYLMSRGIPKKDAQKLLINGLLKPLVDEISDEKLKNKFVSLVGDRL